MGLSMPTPYKHDKTGVYQYRQRPPARLNGAAKGHKATVVIAGKPHPLTIGVHLTVSLGTREPIEAKALVPEVQAQFDLIWARLADAPVRLSSMQCVALAGELFRFFKDTLGDTPEVEADLRRRWLGYLDAKALKAQNPLVIVPAHPWGRWRLAIEHYLAETGLRVDAESLERLTIEFDKAYGDALDMLRQRADGDYSDHPKEKRFPDPATAFPKAAKKAPSALTLSGLLGHKARTRGMKPKTVADFGSILGAFRRFAGHEDARRVTKDEVRRWRDALQEQGLAAKTINNRQLAALKAVLQHGVKEFDLPVNVASGLRDERKASPTGPKGWTQDEALTILKATLKGTNKALSAPHQRALFWVPWICAYTGLRVSEITGFQGRNLRVEGGIPIMHITPEDGSTKSDKAWSVAVHPHLVEMGLLDMLRVIGDGPAFYTPYPAGTDLQKLSGHRAEDAANKVTNWVKDDLGMVAPLGRPNHAWRHLFTTRSREPSHRMDKETRDYMMGSRSTVDAREGYGDFSPAAQAHEIGKLPRFEVKDTGYRPTLEKVAPVPVRGTPAAPRKPRRRLTTRPPAKPPSGSA